MGRSRMIRYCTICLKPIMNSSRLRKSSPYCSRSASGRIAANAVKRSGMPAVRLAGGGIGFGVLQWVRARPRPYADPAIVLHFLIETVLYLAQRKLKMPIGFEHLPADSPLYIEHPSQAKPGIHVFPDKLYVVTMLENPLRWRSRYKNYWAFEQMCNKAGAILYTAEIAFGGEGL